MSMKIYHGYRHPLRGLQAAYDDLMSRRPSILAAGEAVLAGVWARNAAEKIDTAWRAGEPLPKHPLAGIVHEVMRRRREIRASGYRDPEIDNEARYHIFPRGRGKALILIQTEHQSIEAAMSRGLEPFGYWDNTDPPDGVGEAEWERRGKLWDAVLEGGGGNVGLTLDLGFNSPYASMSAIRDAIPGPEWRADRIAKGEVMSEFYPADMPRPEMHQVIEMINSKEFLERVKKLSEEIKGKLPCLLEILRPDP